MSLPVPELSLVLLVGPSGSGKSTFAKKHFKSTEILSSDFFRGLVSDDENDQSATGAAFDALHYVAAKRLEAGRLTVVDATNVRPEDRKPLIELARRYHVLPAAIVLNVSGRLCEDRNQERPDRSFGSHVVRNQIRNLKRSLRGLRREGFRQIHILEGPEEIEAATILREPLWNNRKDEHGPFDLIGDVHGCFGELVELLEKLGYGLADKQRGFSLTPPPGRKAVFVGDLVDRGPNSPDVLRLVMTGLEEETVLCVPGNHDMKLLRHLRGRKVAVNHGLAETLEQLGAETPAFREQVAAFVHGLVSHFVLDDGKLVVAHAGMKESMQGRGSARVRDFALYGETTGEIDEFGLPVRLNWAAEYRGSAMVVYGHTPIPEPEWLNGTVDIDTGCVFGGKLTALRYPEKEFVSVEAREKYCVSKKPLTAITTPDLTAQQINDDCLDLEDVTGKRILKTRLGGSITIREENSAAALEVMSRFAVDPKWLIYLPPTMSPSETSDREGFLEHPDQAFSYYRNSGAEQVVCEQKHMGSRVVAVITKDADAARARFGVTDRSSGVCYTRTGRPFFPDPAQQDGLLGRLRAALDQADFWSRHETDWACFDCELMPWSAKAQALLRSQYASTGSAGLAALPQAMEALAGAPDIEGTGALRDRAADRLGRVEAYVAAYRQYCWPVQSLDDYKLAPFHLLATEGRCRMDQSHVEHMEEIARICDADESGLLLKTPYRVVDLADGASVEAATAWWLELTGSGGEGMVVKPYDYLARGSRGLLQPAVKCRGKEYLRIIYGPEYDAPGTVTKLKKRGLGAKRSLAMRELALGAEALERFTGKEPLRRVHECVFGVLALESEPVDPRL